MGVIKKKYALYNSNTDELVRYYTEDNSDNNHSVNESHYLDDTHYRGKEIWLVDDYETALMAKWTSEEWYNAKYETPVNPFHPKDLSVVTYMEIMYGTGGGVEEEVKKVNQILNKQGYGELSERTVKQVLEAEKEN
jgi:hypothetical protein